VALLIDDLQLLRPEPLAELLATCTDIDDLPIVFLCSGLPSTPRDLWRAGWPPGSLRVEPVGMLAPCDARRAVAEPARAAGRRWSDDALEAVVATTRGHPYLLQQHAWCAWEAMPRAGKASKITRADLERSAGDVRRELDGGWYAALLARTGSAQRAYLQVMAALSGTGNADEAASPPVFSGAIADALGRTPQAVAPIRDALLRAGLVHAPRRGQLEFAVPGFGPYILRKGAATEH